jgi:hypothetical protein
MRNLADEHRRHRTRRNAETHGREEKKSTAKKRGGLRSCHRQPHHADRQTHPRVSNRGKKK